MKYTRLYTGPDGKSHFQDVEVSQEQEKSGDRKKSESMAATSIYFRETGTNYNLDFHPASRRQFVITLDGEVEIEVGDGSKRQFGAGDIMLAEDTHGQGHISRSINNRPRKAIFVVLD